MSAQLESLTNREKIILRHVVEDFIKSATPVGSKTISEKADINLSPATIRNIMSNLEELSLLTHQHTSGGRLPTDKGYRYFVNEIMEVEPLKKSEEEFLKKQFSDLDFPTEDIFREISKILGKLSKEISIVSQPFISEGRLEKIELVLISSTRILVIVSVQSGLIRTLMFEVDSQISARELQNLASILNEKLAGLTLREIRDTFEARFKDLVPASRQVIKIFTDSIDRIFKDEQEGITIYIGGTTEILSQPEFLNLENYKSIIELTDDREVVVHVLNSIEFNNNNIFISIGSENNDEKLKNYSIVSTIYETNGVKGKIALIGPKRMNYSKMVSMLEYTSKIISEY